MKTRKSRLEQLTAKEIEAITAHAEKNKNVPLVATQQVNMRLRTETLRRIKALASVRGIPYTTFLSRLLQEDIDRLWSVFKNPTSLP